MERACNDSRDFRAIEALRLLDIINKLLSDLPFLSPFHSIHPIMQSVTRQAVRGKLTLLYTRVPRELILWSIGTIRSSSLPRSPQTCSISTGEVSILPTSVEITELTRTN